MSVLCYVLIKSVWKFKELNALTDALNELNRNEYIDLDIGLSGAHGLEPEPWELAWEYAPSEGEWNNGKYMSFKKSEMSFDVKPNYVYGSIRYRWGNFVYINKFRQLLRKKMFKFASIFCPESPEVVYFNETLDDSDLMYELHENQNPSYEEMKQTLISKGQKGNYQPRYQKPGEIKSWSGDTGYAYDFTDLPAPDAEVQISNLYYLDTFPDFLAGTLTLPE
jgi:hypothetical protein